jgi:hypothetical protein
MAEKPGVCPGILYAWFWLAILTTIVLPVAICAATLYVFTFVGEATFFQWLEVMNLVVV